MLKVVAALTFLGVCWAAVLPPQSVAPSIVPSIIPIVNEENVVEPDGSFHYGYETADGTLVHQEGQIKQFEDEQGQVVQGSYTYTDKDGKTFSVTYIADENGFQPQGEHLPVAPEIPGPIVKALKFIEEHPPPPGEPQL